MRRLCHPPDSLTLANSARGAIAPANPNAAMAGMERGEREVRFCHLVRNERNASEPLMGGEQDNIQHQRDNDAQ